MKLTSLEQRAAISIAGIYGLRMLGLFLVLPVLVIYARSLPDYTPALAGIAVGIYGLGQAMLQIPLGYLSDKMGRKLIIILGLLLFATGSFIAAESETLVGIITGRALQGAGAIASTLMAFVSDLSRPAVRSKLMAAIGATIGIAFVLSLILGPWLTSYIGVSGLFFLTGILSFLAIGIVIWVVPTEQQHIDNSHVLPVQQQMNSVLANGQLQLMNFSIFCLHMFLTAIFVMIPIQLIDSGMPLEEHSLTYLGLMVVSFAVMLPLMIWTEKKRQHVRSVALAVSLLLIALMTLSFQSSLTIVLVCLGIFFLAFNFLEAMIPSIVSRLCASKQRGTAMGFYSSSQFFGAFLGGLLAGYTLEQFNGSVVYTVLGCICLIWLCLVVVKFLPVTDLEQDTDTQSE